MKIKKGFILHRIGDEYIIMQDGSSNVDFSKVINLNKTSAMLWKAMENKDFDVNTLAKALTEHYEIDVTTAHRDAQKFIGSLQQEGVIE